MSWRERFKIHLRLSLRLPLSRCPRTYRGREIVAPFLCALHFIRIILFEKRCSNSCRDERSFGVRTDLTLDKARTPVTHKPRRTSILLAVIIFTRQTLTMSIIRLKHSSDQTLKQPSKLQDSKTKFSQHKTSTSHLQVTPRPHWDLTVNYAALFPRSVLEICY